ncbi:rRNA methyltransferase 1, mitochondrial isoform X2 [Heterocephalus glaber]|uniref:rRNA methyltransferase 1, mitochondrial n=1 Tax=Heterocephalus glaber TaxID=10181 RepID=A0AAX6S7D5_HETGA|nr:rRNA methyltransferase 1, mitochondrial isoform X2 [Heterocephalus glaber]
MGLLWTIRAATRGCSDRLVARHFSQAARREVRPGGEELRRLRLDDLAPTPRLELLFGLSPCLLALRAARRRVARLLLQAGGAGLQEARAELLRTAEARDIPVLRPRRQKLDALCHYQMHQGVCMEVTPLRPQPYTEPGEASPSDDPQQLWLVLEGLQDPRNLGAVLRSAHFLGVDKIIISRRNSCPLTPIVSKASAGAMEVMDVFSTNDLPGFLQEFFFTPFAARGRVSLQRRKGGNFSRTLQWKDSDWLNTQDCVRDQKEKGTKRAEGPSELWGTRVRVATTPPVCYSLPAWGAKALFIDSNELWGRGL